METAERKASMWTTSMSLPVVGIFVAAQVAVIGALADAATLEDSVLRWQWILLYLLLFGGTATYATTGRDFYSGGQLLLESPADCAGAGKAFSALSLSAFISWVFAKSVYNAATLGAAFGWVGGLAYASYYISFLSAAIVIAALRAQGFDSLPSCIHIKYGPAASIAFLLAISYRLFNEVWSNSVVVADFYGATKTSQWWAAVVVGTAIPAFYVFLGGLRASIYSDVAQAVVAICFLVIVAGFVGAENSSNEPLIHFNPVPGRDMWSLEGGFDLLCVGLLQGLFSYPFFDPVLTDRAFLSTPRIMVASFITAGCIGALFIFGFSFLGVYGASVGVGGKPAEVSAFIGPIPFTFTALIMITSSLSTLDSTFSSTSKAWGLEAMGIIKTGAPLTAGQAVATDLAFGRIALVLMAVIGTLPLLGDATVLSATTISGTVVMGLGPPVIGGVFFGQGTKRCDYRTPLAFHLPFWTGVGFGIALQVGVNPALMVIGTGKYAQLLGFNLYGLLACTAMYVLGLSLHAFVLPRRASASSRDERSAGVKSNDSSMAQA